MKYYKPAIFLFFFVVTTVYAEEHYKKFGNGSVVFVKQNLNIVVEVATTKMQRTIGLMFRQNLALNKGMLFDFGQEAVQRVWMRNTLIPLDVVFISDNGKVVSLLKKLQPCIKDPCAKYDSKKIARYMLELNAGVCERENIEIGERVLFFL